MIIEISIGEAFDRLTILKIKSEKIKDDTKLTNVMREYFYLLNLMKEELEVDEDNEDFKRLFNVNSQLWDVENKLRECEEKGDFIDEFIKLSIKLYEKGYSGVDIINLLETPKFMETNLTLEKKYELLFAFNKVRKEFRNETLLIMFILNFLYLSLETSLENISFM